MTALYRLTKNKCAFITLNNPPVNAMGLAVREAVVKGLKQASEDGARGLVLMGENGLFTGGADIVEFTKGTFTQRPHLHDMIFGIESMKMPVATFLEGSTMGGGVEIALASHYRVTTSNCVMGLPEVHLGLLPGAGGTQRLPRLVGCDKAFDIMATGRHVPAAEALEMGLVDKMLQEEGSARLDELEDYLLSDSVQDTDLDSRIVSKRTVSGGPVSEKLHAQSFGGFVAPSLIHLAVDATRNMDFVKGLEYEFKLFDSLMKGSQARAMQYLFFASRKFQKRVEAGEVSAEIAPRIVKMVATCMAELIAEGCAREHIESVLKSKVGLSKKLFKQIPDIGGVSEGDVKDAECPVSEEDIVERVMYPLVNEAYRMLDEGVTDSPDDIDLTCVAGLGFPRYLGGPLFWTESELTSTTVFEKLKVHGGDEPRPHYVPTSLLEDVAASGSNVREELYFRSK